MLEIVARRPDEVCWTAGYLPLRAAALNLYEHPVSGSPSAEYLATRIAELLSVERDEIWRYGITNLRRLAAHLVDQLDELRALDLVRLTILACSIRGDVCHDAGPAVDTDRLKAVRAAFGRTDQEEAKRLVELGPGQSWPAVVGRAALLLPHLLLWRAADHRQSDADDECPEPEPGDQRNGSLRAIHASTSSGGPWTPGPSCRALFTR